MTGYGQLDGQWEQAVCTMMQDKVVGLGRLRFTMVLLHVQHTIQSYPDAAIKKLKLLQDKIEQWKTSDACEQLEKCFLLKELHIGCRSEVLPMWTGLVFASSRKKDAIVTRAPPHWASFASFITPKDQGWGELLDSKLVNPGDTILSPGRGKNMDRSALVQSDGTLLEDHSSTTWIDPVAFCLSNNGWKKSATFLIDRNRMAHCARMRGGTEDACESLFELRIEARKRNSLEGDEEHRRLYSRNNLKPGIGARVQVRFDVDRKIRWFTAQLIDFDKTTREWTIKLDICEEATQSQRECDGCCECVHQLQSGTKHW